MATKRRFAGLVCLLLMSAATACAETDNAQTPPPTIAGIPIVRTDHSHEARRSEEAGDGGTDLISGYLRQADSPEQLLENFSDALRSRNGAVARLFLQPELRHVIKPQVIGASTPLHRIDMNPAGPGQYTLTAYFAPYADQPEQLAFEWRATVEPERPDLTGKGGRYFITGLECLLDATGNAWGSPPPQQTP